MIATYRRRKENLTAERARELLVYAPETGALTWRVHRQGNLGSSEPGNLWAASPG